MQWLKKEATGLLETKVLATQDKQLPLPFSKTRGLFTLTLSPGPDDNIKLNVKASTLFMMRLRLKRPELVLDQWFCHWVNAPIHTAAIVQDWLAARNIQVLPQPPNLPDLTPADFFLFPMLKKEPAGCTLLP